MEPDISRLLQEARDGNETARDLLYSELHAQLRDQARGLLANEQVDHTLQATALVNEACVKLLREGVVDSSENRRQLFHAAIRAMRQVLTDHARARSTTKRGGEFTRQPLDVVLNNFERNHSVTFLDLELALERLQRESSREHEALTLRFFGGLTIAETAKLMGTSDSTVESDWRLARAKLVAWLKDS